MVLISLFCQTPLFIACEKGNLEVVKELLKHESVDVNKGVSILMVGDGINLFVLLECKCFDGEKWY